MSVHTLNAPKGANKAKTIVGRGCGSKGKTCGRGSNGQNSRSGGGVKPGFEGGQMPLFRRLARRGFSNYPFKQKAVVIKLDSIAKKYDENETVNIDSLQKKGLIKKSETNIKILAGSELNKKLKFENLKFSKAALAQIEKSGSEVAVMEKQSESKEQD